METVTSRASHRLTLFIGPAAAFLVGLASPAPAIAQTDDFSQMTRSRVDVLAGRPVSLPYDRDRAVQAVREAFEEYWRIYGSTIEALKAAHPVTREWACGQWTDYLVLNFSDRGPFAGFPDLAEYEPLVVNRAVRRLPVYHVAYLGPAHAAAAVYLPAVEDPARRPGADAPAYDWLLVGAQDGVGRPQVLRGAHVPNIERVRSGLVVGLRVARLDAAPGAPARLVHLRQYDLTWGDVSRGALSDHPKGRKSDVVDSILDQLEGNERKTSKGKEDVSAAIERVLDILEGRPGARWSTSPRDRTVPYVRVGGAVVTKDGRVYCEVLEGGASRMALQGRADIEAFWRAGR